MDFYLSFGVVFISTVILAMIFTPIAIRIAHKIGAVDIPKDSRRMHTKPIPRFGGMAIFIATMAGLVLVKYVAYPMCATYFEKLNVWMLLPQPISKITGLIVGGAMIYVLGIIDDLKGMNAKVKFLGQIICASAAYAFGIRISFVTSFLTEGHIFFAGVLCYFITVIWIVGITNTVNLIDGLDGLAGGTSFIASLCLAYTAYIHGSYVAAMAFIAVAGACIGFLKYNFHPAKTFMGDGGSLFLGYMLATISIIGPAKGATVLAMIAPVLVLGVPIFDTGFAILRRLINHRPIMEADKGHLHHRLMAAGFGQRRAVLMLYGVSAIMGVASILFSRDLFVETVALLFTAAMYIFIFVTDAKRGAMSLKGINIADIEKKQGRQQTEKDNQSKKSS